MSITANVNGTLKKLETVHANVSGTVKDLGKIHSNINGTIKMIFPGTDVPYAFRIATTGGGGAAGHISSSTDQSDWQYAVIGYRWSYSNTVSATGASGTPVVSFVNQSGSFYPKTNCKIRVKTLTNASVSIDGAKKPVGTYAVSSLNKISFSFNISATSSSNVAVSTYGAIDFDLVAP